MRFSRSGYEAKINKLNPGKERAYFSFRFDLQLQEGGEVIVASRVPYTYTDLCRHLKQINLCA